VSLSSNSTTLPVAASVTVAAGSTSAAFTATAGAIGANQTATLKATLNGVSKTAGISLVASIGVSSLGCSPASLGQNASSTCTVTLTQAALTGGASVALSSNTAALTVPASVTVAAGSTTATFSAAAGTISSNQTATVTATYSSTSATASISLVASVHVSSLSCIPTTLGHNSSSTCTVTLTQAALTGGASVALSSNLAALTVPASVTVAAGSTTATFSATAGTISSNQTATVTATYNSTSATASISLSVSAFVSSLSCSPTTLTSGTSATCTITAANLSGGWTLITLTKSNPLLTLPSSVTLKGGSSTAKFTATAGTITANQTAIVTASLNGSAKSVTFTLNTTGQQTSQAQIRLTGLSCTPGTLPAQSTGLCSITLGKVADGAAAQVRLSSSSASLQLPALIATRPGQTSVQFQVNSATYVKDEAAVISAQLNADTMQQTVSLQPSHDTPIGVPASPVVRFGSELRFQVSAAGQSAALTAGPLPAGATFDGSTGVFDWTPSAAQQGKYRLAFTATDSAGQAGTAYSEVEVDAGEPIVDSIANAASGSVKGACSPGAIARIEGRWLTPGNTASDPSGGSLELAGTSVQVEGESVPILFASASRIDILCPDAVPALPFQIVVKTTGSVSQPVETMQNVVAPGIFTADGSGSGQGLVFLDGESKLAMVRNYLSEAQPARPGDRILFFATGIGTVSNVLVRIGEAEVPAASVAPVPGRPGVSQITAIVPDGAAVGNSISLSIVGKSADGSSVASNSVSMAIEEK